MKKIHQYQCKLVPYIFFKCFLYVCKARVILSYFEHYNFFILYNSFFLCFFPLFWLNLSTTFYTHHHTTIKLTVDENNGSNLYCWMLAAISTVIKLKPFLLLFFIFNGILYTYHLNVIILSFYHSKHANPFE